MPRTLQAADIARPLGAFVTIVGISWYAALMLPLWRAGPICGDMGVLLLGHCPACYAALALASAGLLALFAPVVRPARAVAPRRR